MLAVGSQRLAFGLVGRDERGSDRLLDFLLLCCTQLGQAAAASAGFHAKKLDVAFGGYDSGSLVYVKGRFFYGVGYDCDSGDTCHYAG